jgi:hypothetical protein
MQGIARPILLASVGLSLLSGPARTADSPATPYLYAAAVDKNREVLVDVDADRSNPGAPSMLVFFLFARRVNGHDVWIYNYQFDCQAGSAAVVQATEESRNIEPLNLGDVAPVPNVVPAGSLLGAVMRVACNGRAAIPASWRPTPLNLRQASKWYYETYLGGHS